MRAEQRIPSRLSNVSQVLHVDKQTDGAKGVLGQSAEEHISLRLGAIGVLLQALVPRVVAFNSDAASFFFFPNTDESETLARSERSIDFSVRLKLAGANVSVAGGSREGGGSQRAE